MSSHAAKKVHDTIEENFNDLTPKQHLYLENRIGGMSVKAAAAAAGYSANSSRVYRDLENHPRLKYLLQDMTQKALARVQITRDDVIQGFVDSLASAQSSTEMIMAWREIGKIVGAYAPEVKVVAHVDITAEKLRSMDDQQLLELADQEDFNLPIIEGECEVLSTEDQDLSTEDQEGRTALQVEEDEAERWQVDD